MNFFDAHFHLVQSVEALGAAFCGPLCGITAAHSAQEFIKQEDLVKSRFGLLGQSFGLHPQNPLLENADFLEGLLRQKRICAIGECGFDLWTEDFKQNLSAQEKAFLIQVELSKKYNAPVIIHARKAMQKIFENIGALKECPAVVFHSFSGTVNDALSLLRAGVNAYFSFGKPLMNGAKKALLCVKSLPLDRLLLETDAPYQTLRAERATSPAEIFDVYQTAFEVKNIPLLAVGKKALSFFDFTRAIEENYKRAFFTSCTVAE